MGFLFKITELKSKKNNKNQNEILNNQLIPHDKSEVIFYLLKLNYIRILLVTVKSGFRNLREKELNIISNNELVPEKKIKKNKRRSSLDDSSEEEVKYILTKDKILELQGKDAKEIKSFINILDFYGNDISLVMHRPNKEKYPCGKAQEPLIKINLSNFTKRIEENLKKNPNYFKRIKNKKNQNEKIEEKDEKNELNINQISTTNQNENNKNELEEVNTNLNKDSSLTLMNIFNVKSIKTIKCFDFFIYIFIISIFVIEFILNYIYLSDNKNRFLYFTYPYRFMCNLLYSKYFVNELVFIYNIPNYIFLQYVEKQNYISYVKEELANFQEKLSATFNDYNRISISLSKEYTIAANKNIMIKTISNGVEKYEEQPFSLALSRIITSIFYISTVDEGKIDMDDSHIYEVMVNVLDNYFAYYESLINIVIIDLKEYFKKCGIKNIIIFIISVFISLIYLFLFYKMMNKLDNDREKPINLFLTIKKNIFEDLQNSSENFSNKLLNNVFGGEESEEESQKEYRNNLNPNDINLAKFKALNGYKVFNNKGVSFFSYFVQLAIFYLIINILILIKYINQILYYRKVENFIDIYNSTYYSHILLITRIDVHKQFYYNSSITNFNLTKDGTFFDYLLCFFNLPNQFEYILKETSKKDSFSNEIKNTIEDYFYGNITNVIRHEIGKIKAFNYTKEYSSNFNTNNFEFFEKIRYITIKYFINSQRNNSNSSVSDLINDYRWLDINAILINIIRPWYQSFNTYFESLFYEYVKERQIYYIYFFIIQIALVSFYYWIIWKKYENYFFDLIKKSFDLIYLIPEELKDIIVNKLNETNS